MRRTDRLALELCAYVIGDSSSTPAKVRLAEDITKQLAPKPRKVKAGRTIAQDKAKKRAAHKMSTSEIRAECMARAQGRCECGCNSRLASLDVGAEMDHFDGGSGKAQRQTVANCWILARLCHRHRQRSFPSVADWNRRFAAHCARYGYLIIAHITHQAVEHAGVSK